MNSRGSGKGHSSQSWNSVDNQIDISLKIGFEGKKE
jgi:hypothetical protein